MARRKRQSSKSGSSNQNNVKSNLGNPESKGLPDQDKQGSDKDIQPTSTEMPSAANDPEWYARDPRLLVDAASIPFSLPFGDKIDWFDGISVMPGGVSIDATHPKYAIPGVCTLLLKPSLGYNMDKSSPANVCANALYAHVRYVNSGRKNYDPADLFMYACTFGDIYGFIYWMIRLYQYAYMYSQRNWYVGRDLIIANGVNADNLVTNLANFRYWINAIINKVSSFCIPNDIYYLKRRVFCFANYYLENRDGNIKDQIYQFAPEGFYAFAIDSNTGAGKLEYQPIVGGGALLTINDIASYFEGVLMANITGDEDFGLMSGDIYKAYGDNGIFHVPELQPDGGLLPVWDPYVLSQFKNALVVKDLYRAGSSSTYKDLFGGVHKYGDIEQSTNGLVISCESIDWSNHLSTGAWAAAHHAISVENPEPGVGDVIEATRLMPFLGLLPDYDNPGTYKYALNGGTEICVNMIVSHAPAATGTDLSGEVSYQNTVPAAGITISLMRDFASFKYAPTLWFVGFSGTTSLNIWEFASNMDNTTTVSNDILKRLHDVALLSLFFVPGVAKLIS